MEKKLIISKLDNLKELTTPVFGIMSPQHMVEHITLTLKLSSGRIKILEFEPSENQLTQKNILLNTAIEFPRGINAPGLEGTLLALKNDSLVASVDQLLESLEYYNQYFSENPDSKPIHPRFGKLNHEEWEKFHAKHFKHHFSQFEIW